MAIIAPENDRRRNNQTTADSRKSEILTIFAAARFGPGIFPEPIKRESGENPGQYLLL